MTKEQEFRKQAEEAKFEAFSFMCKKVAELEKENAELKEKLKPENCLKSLAKSGLVKFTCENGNEHDQLTKAKDLLLKLSTCLEGHSNNNFEYELIKEAEQFLNSEVEK